MHPKEYGLLELAFEARSEEATDLRDKVFALLGLAKDAKGLRSNHSENPATLQIDYRSSVRSLYIDVTDELQEVLAEARQISLHKNYPLGSLIGVFKREEMTSMKIVVLSALPRTSSESGRIYPGSLPTLARTTLIPQGTRIDTITN